mgnify:CR=1 FL=1
MLVYAQSDFYLDRQRAIDLDMRPSDKAREILKEDGWTQQRLAAEVGVSQSTVNRWLSGSEPEGANRDALNALYDTVFGAASQPKVPLKGYIGAGQAIYPLEDGGEELVEAPPRPRASASTYNGTAGRRISRAAKLTRAYKRSITAHGRFSESGSAARLTPMIE